jgi:fructose-1,6-bisphosphatase II
MLYIGEKVGTGKGAKIDIALDPLEGTDICANYAEGALSVIATTPAGNMLHAPDIYMEKIAIGKNLPENVVDLGEDLATNLKNLAKAKKCNTKHLKAIILNRPRHQELISSLRKLGVRIKLIKDGDISAILEVAYGDADIYMGIGGAPEGVLAAAAINAIGGQLQCRLVFSSNQEIERARLMNIKDTKTKYNSKDMVGEDSIFVATGVTDGTLLKGTRKTSSKIVTESLITDSSRMIVYKLSSCYFK